MVKISIIVPVYNVERYLKRCLDSLINQTLRDIEILIINDGSPDNSESICNDYLKKDSRIKYFKKENEGLGLTRNYGIKKATGEYICFVDSDDYVTLDMAEKLYKNAKKYNADIVYGNVIYDNLYNQIEGNHIKDNVVYEKDNIQNFLLDMVATLPKDKNDTIMEVSVWKAIFRRKIFHEYNIFFESERKYISEDVIFNIDYMQHCDKIVTIPDNVYYYCLNPESLSKVFRTDRFSKVKILYKEVNRKLSLLFDKNIYEIRTDRFLIARARTNIKNIVKNRKKITKEDYNNSLKNICNDTDLIKILYRYPINRLPIKYYIVCLFIKYKFYIGLKTIFR